MRAAKVVARLGCIAVLLLASVSITAAEPFTAQFHVRVLTRSFADEGGDEPFHREFELLATFDTAVFFRDIQCCSEVELYGNPQFSPIPLRHSTIPPEIQFGDNNGTLNGWIRLDDGTFNQGGYLYYDRWVPSCRRPIRSQCGIYLSLWLGTWTQLPSRSQRSLLSRGDSAVAGRETSTFSVPDQTGR